MSLPTPVAYTRWSPGPPANGWATIFWHTDRLPDDDRRFSAPRPAPERIELATIKTDVEFAIGQLSRLHKQLARTAPASSSARRRLPPCSIGGCWHADAHAARSHRRGDLRAPQPAGRHDRGRPLPDVAAHPALARDPRQVRRGGRAAARTRAEAPPLYTAAARSPANARGTRPQPDPTARTATAALADKV